MPGPDVHENMRPEGIELESAARENAEWLKLNFKPEYVEQWKSAGLLDDEGEVLLNTCMDTENYIPMDDVKRARVDQLIESLKEFETT